MGSTFTSTLPEASSTRHAYTYHEERHGLVRAPANLVFAHLDGHARLAAHMERPSWRTAWGRMGVRLDALEGRAVGSLIMIEGKVLGISLRVEERVVHRSPPAQKVWETVGPVRLLVIGPYRMGFVLTPIVARDDSIELRVFVDYDLPDGGLPRLLGMIFGRWYARWCTSQMVADAIAAFKAGHEKPVEGAAVGADSTDGTIALLGDA